MEGDFESLRLVLASASPSRRRVLSLAGIAVEVVPSGVNEDAVDTTDPQVQCAVLARQKAQAVARRLATEAPAASGSPAGAAASGGTPAMGSPAGGTPAEAAASEGTPPAVGSPAGAAAAAAATGVAGGGPAGRGLTGGVLVLGCDSVLGFAGEALGKPADPAEAKARLRRMRGREGVLYTGHALVELRSGRTVEAVDASLVRFAQLTDAEVDAYVATGEPLAVAGAFTIEGYGAPFVERVEGNPGGVMGLSLPTLRRLLAELGVPITALWRPPDTSDARDAA